MAKNISIMIIEQFWYNIDWCNASVTTSQVELDYNQVKKKKKICNTSDAGTSLDLSEARSWLSIQTKI